MLLCVPPPPTLPALQGYLLQMMAAKLGLATRRHLAQHCRAEYPGAMRWFLWVMIEIGEGGRQAGGLVRLAGTREWSRACWMASI